MVDLTFLEKFTKGDQTKMKRYIGMYLAIAPDTFIKMRQNIADADWDQLRINAHSLKPQADYMGISGLKEVLVEIENGAASGDLGLLSGLFEKAFELHLASEAILKEAAAQ